VTNSTRSAGSTCTSSTFTSDGCRTAVTVEQEHQRQIWEGEMTRGSTAITSCSEGPEGPIKRPEGPVKRPEGPSEGLKGLGTSLSPMGAVVFVDDDVREHLDPDWSRLRPLGIDLYRVLFMRGSAGGL
jgi:hypothetical protein